jgi:hypothetical protein
MARKLEEALIKTELATDAALKAANATLNSLKNLRKSIRTGNLKDIKKNNDSIDQAIQLLVEKFSATKESWAFDEDEYFSGREFLDEIQEFSQELGINLYELDNRLFCYPCIIRLLAGDRAVAIDKTREKRIRPSFLVEHLKSLQNKPVKFKSEAFLESLHDAYVICIQKKDKSLMDCGLDIPLIDIYNLFTLLPGQSKEYSKQEFARDIYLLDQSNIMVTKNGLKMKLEGSTLSKSPGKCLTIVTKSGQEKKYGTIAFSKVS